MNELQVKLLEVTATYEAGASLGKTAECFELGDVVEIGQGIRDDYVPVINQALAYNVCADIDQQYEIALAPRILIQMGIVGIESLEGIPQAIEGLCAGDKVTVTDITKIDLGADFDEDTDEATKDEVVHTVTVRTADGQTYRVSSGLLVISKGSMVNGRPANEVLDERRAALQVQNKEVVLH